MTYALQYATGTYPESVTIPPPSFVCLISGTRAMSWGHHSWFGGLQMGTVQNVCALGGTDWNIATKVSKPGTHRTSGRMELYALEKG